MQAEHKKLRPILDRKRKKELDKKIEHVEGELRVALYYYEHDYRNKAKPRQIYVSEPLPQKRLHRDDYYLRKTKTNEYHR
ncbi:MAG: hypothetical protein LBE70_02395 [Nitrososphaerota archaeon]|nr:hypothetical protein [Nitrososphaerota archaeon]